MLQRYFGRVYFNYNLSSRFFVNTRKVSTYGIPELPDGQDWDGELMNIPVEYTSSGKRSLGLLQRPQGRRMWWVLTQDGREIKVNKFNILFQWPKLQEEGEQIYEPLEFTLTNLRILQQEISDIFNQLAQKIPVEDIYDHFFNWCGEEPISGYSVALYCSKRDPSFTMSPTLIYSCHRLMLENDLYFKPQSIHGFKCRDIELVTLQKEKIKREEEDRIASAKFVEKIQKLLQIIRTKKENERNMNFDNNEDLNKNETPISDDLIFDPNYDKKYLSSIKNYALTQRASPDQEVIEKFLSPLGFGDKPHHAFGLLLELDIFRKFDNPHVLRNNHLILPHAKEAQKESEKIFEEY